MSTPSTRQQNVSTFFDFVDISGESVDWHDTSERYRTTCFRPWHLSDPGVQVIERGHRNGERRASARRVRGDLQKP
jgi:hypothetical protein